MLQPIVKLGLIWVCTRPVVDVNKKEKRNYRLQSCNTSTCHKHPCVNLGQKPHGQRFVRHTNQTPHAFCHTSICAILKTCAQMGVRRQARNRIRTSCSRGELRKAVFTSICFDCRLSVIERMTVRKEPEATGAYMASRSYCTFWISRNPRTIRRDLSISAEIRKSTVSAYTRAVGIAIPPSGKQDVVISMTFLSVIDAIFAFFRSRNLRERYSDTDCRELCGTVWLAFELTTFCRVRVAIVGGECDGKHMWMEWTSICGQLWVCRYTTLTLSHNHQPVRGHQSMPLPLSWLYRIW